jgi:hypothetical protein
VILLYQLTLYGIELVDDLIIEQGAFDNDQSQVCRILNNLKQYVPDGCFISEFLLFLEKGLVIYCDQSNSGTIYIGSVEKFIEYVNKEIGTINQDGE